MFLKEIENLTNDVQIVKGPFSDLRVTTEVIFETSKQYKELFREYIGELNKSYQVKIYNSYDDGYDWDSIILSDIQIIKITTEQFKKFELHYDNSLVTASPTNVYVTYRLLLGNDFCGDGISLGGSNIDLNIGLRIDKIISMLKDTDLKGIKVSPRILKLHTDNNELYIPNSDICFCRHIADHNSDSVMIKSHVLDKVISVKNFISIYLDIGHDASCIYGMPIFSTNTSSKNNTPVYDFKSLYPTELVLKSKQDDHKVEYDEESYSEIKL